MLPKLTIATPCPADWYKMVGDDKVRFCSLCNLNVYNLSAMSEATALNVLRNREGRLCARIYQRPDGTVLTQDCPVGVRAAHRRMARFATAALSAIFAWPFFPAHASAQTTDQAVQIRPGETGVIVRVTDPVGAVIPNANVRLVENQKTVFELKANNEGIAHFSPLNTGDYRLIISSPGIRTFERPIAVSAASITNVKAELAVGEVWVGLIIEEDQPFVNVDSQQLEQQVPLRALPSAPVLSTGDGPAKRSIK